ncbi:MAG: hypothetical protein J6V44_15055 [Methanobrevibacter sp.]|nr:hypothetical protein [Methanobrevibacter sp.]MBO7696548.1 hypothetical protein [Methanobrevibacter sp.]
MENWQTIQKQEFEYLDSIDLIPYVISETNVDKLMDIIDENFNQDYISKCKLPDEGIFFWMTLDDFLDYICKRYKITYWERTEYLLNVNSLKKDATCKVCRFYSIDCKACLCKGPELESHNPNDKICADFKFKENKK